MLNRREISIGKCYVRDRAHVRMPHQICPQNQLIRGAAREARPNEFARLKRDDGMAIFESEVGESKLVV